MSEHNNNNEETRPQSTAEKLLADQAIRDQHDDHAVENFAVYREALNGVASTPNGKIVLKRMIKAMGVFAVKPNRDGVALVGDKALRDFYLTMIRPHLDVTIRQELED